MSPRKAAVNAPPRTTATTTSNRPRRESLSLTTYTLPGHSGARAWALLLRRFQKLARLSLRGNGIGKEECGPIADALVHNNALHTLILSHNPLGQQGAMDVLDAVREHKGQLSFLGLSNVGLTASAAAALVTAISDRTLDVAGMKRRAEYENRIVTELVTDINGLGFRASLLPGIQAELDAAAAAHSALASEAAVPVADPKGKGKAAPAPAPAPAAEIAPSRPTGDHPDFDLWQAFRLRAAKETTPKTNTAEAEAEAGTEQEHKRRAHHVPRVFQVQGNSSLCQVDISSNSALGAEGLHALAVALAGVLPVQPAPEPAGSRRASNTGTGKGASPSPSPDKPPASARRASVQKDSKAAAAAAAAAASCPAMEVKAAPPRAGPKLAKLVTYHCVPDTFTTPAAAIRRHGRGSVGERGSSPTLSEGRPSSRAQSPASYIRASVSNTGLSMPRVTDHDALERRAEQASTADRAKILLAGLGIDLLV